MKMYGQLVQQIGHNEFEILGTNDVIITTDKYIFFHCPCGKEHKINWRVQFYGQKSGQFDCECGGHIIIN